MIKVYISQPGYSGRISIAVVDERNGKRYLAKPVELEFEEMEEEKDYLPTFQLPRMMGEMFLQAFAEALDEVNVKTEKDAKIAGVLEATRLHLEDMRRLVFRGRLIPDDKEVR